jgi:SAM-dependent methyltransferase
MADSSTPDFLHKEFPKKFARDDFWAQIKRTVNGQPVSERDIALIVEQIKRNLRLTADSHLLDLGCGNGALAARLFPYVRKYAGVDFSSYLLGIAREYFQPNSNITYIEADARTFVGTHVPTESFDRVLIYGCMSYFTREDFSVLLSNVHRRFPGVSTLFVGNVPDLSRAAEFFAARKIVEYELENPQTPIGVWWAPGHLRQLGERIGFSAECLVMPDEFYGSRYRFDVVFRRSDERPSAKPSCGSD